LEISKIIIQLALNNFQFHNLQLFYHLSMKFVCLFVCFVSHVEIFQTIVPLVALLIPLESPLMNRDASHNVSIYNGKVIKYGTIFSLKIH
jgi:hypothetical protein